MVSRIYQKINIAHPKCEFQSLRRIAKYDSKSISGAQCKVYKLAIFRRLGGTIAPTIGAAR